MNHSTIHIRKADAQDYPAIVDIHNFLNIVWPEKPRTAAGWAEADRNRNPGLKFQRWVAVYDGEVVGFGSYGQSSLDYHPQRFYINIEVPLDKQRQGIGSALYDHIMAALQPFDPRVLRADTFANLPQGYDFIHKRGFNEVFRETPVHLDIEKFNPGPYTDLESSLFAKGIKIKTLREMEWDADRDHKLYDLFWETFEDVPQEDSHIEKAEFTEWVRWGLNDPTILPDAYFIATFGESYIGMRELYKDPDNNILLGGWLGVRRPYRGLGVGLAMQLRGIAYAREQGYPVLKTCTAIQNAPMQALFNKLGYARDPEWQQCQKDITP
jgi:mycothiol synthase